MTQVQDQAGERGVRCVQRAYLTFAETDEGCDVDPDEITRRAGLEPTRVHRAGEPIGPNGRRRRRNGWYVDVPERDEYDTEVLLCELLDVVEPHAAGIARACRELRLIAGINVVISMHSVRDEDGLLVTTPALSLRADTLRRIADLGCWLDCDQYVY
jgi:hypothetical protein